MIHITTHAIQRYTERVEPVTPAQAHAALSSPAITLAAQFGAPYVRLGTGQRVVIHKDKVLTVLPAGHPEAWMSMASTMRHVWEE